MKELVPLYVLGALDAETAREIEASLRRASPEQQREIAEWREVAGLLAEAPPQVSPPPHLKDQLLDRISSRSQETPIETAVAESLPATTDAKVLPFAPARRVESKTARWLLAAATVVLSFTSAYLFWQNSKLRSERGQLINERGQLTEKVNSLENQFDHLVSPATRVIEMAGAEAPRATAKVIWDQHSRQWAIYIFDLPAPPSDKDYQLWYVTNDAKISATVFRPEAGGRTVLKLTLPTEALNGLAATAVTLEPKGGSAQPTGKFYLTAPIKTI